jgi:carboxyl-terminal processing protease
MKTAWILAFTALTSLSASSFAAESNELAPAASGTPAQNEPATGLATAEKVEKSEKSEKASASKQARESISMKDIQTFTAVMRAIQDTYVEQTDSHKLIESAIRGMLSGLDPHSEYLDASSLQQLDEQTAGEYAGLGVEVVAMDGVLRVIAPIDDSPASRAGVKAGDAIVSVDGKAVTQENQNDSVESLRGAPGSKIALTLKREGQDEQIEMSIMREVIKVASVKGRMLEPGYAYVRVSQFQQETGSEVREKIRRLSGKGALKGLVLDLRSNPGGIINSAVEVADAFLDDGVIVTTRGRVSEAESTYTATRGDLLNGAPLVVLVDSGSASAAEIVAGALRDHHRALLIGNNTFGKGSVQTVMPLDQTRAVKLTTARYYTPTGISIQASGIKPDIELGDLRLAKADAPATVISERDLAGHLRGDAELAGSAKEAKPERDAALSDDYGLSEALNVLKGMVLARANIPPATKVASTDG